MVELGFKARRAWSRAPPPRSGSVESWVSLYKHSRKSEEPTSWEKPRCRHHCHHHHGNRQGVVPLCTGCCVEHWEDKESSGPTMGLINLTSDPSGCLKCLHFHEAVSAHVPQPPCIMYLLWWPFYFCLCSATYLLLSILYCGYLYTLVTQLSLCTLLSPLPDSYAFFEIPLRSCCIPWLSCLN